MVNEFVYCPRLFFYEWVEGVFRESADTLEGAAQHKRVDASPTALPEPAQRPPPAKRNPSRPVRHPLQRTPPRHRHARSRRGRRARPPLPSITNMARRAIAKMGSRMWPQDRVQLALQAIVLRENGYQCDEVSRLLPEDPPARARSG